MQDCAPTRICARHPSHRREMCLIQSPHSETELALQLRGAPPGQHQWCFDRHRRLLAADTGGSHAITLDLFTAHMSLRPPAHPHPASSDHELAEHHHHSGQSWDLDPEDGHLCVLPQRELCLVVEPDAAGFRPVVVSYQHARTLMPGGWSFHRIGDPPP